MPAKSRFAIIDEDLTAATVSACKLCRFFTEAAPADAAYIEQMLITSASAHVARVLTAGGVAVTESSVKRHKRLHS